MNVFSNKFLFGENHKICKLFIRQQKDNFFFLRNLSITAKVLINMHLNFFDLVKKAKVGYFS